MDCNVPKEKSDENEWYERNGFIMKKKITSLALALAMCFALALPAFATSQTGNLTTELSSMLPELKMTLPEASTIILNPYRNTVAESVATASAGIDKGDKLQVMNAVFSVVSTTTNKVHVKATVTGSVGGNAEFASAAVAPGTAGHKVNLTLTYALASGTTATVPAPDKVTNPTNVKVISDSEQALEWDLPPATSSGATATQRLDMQFGGTCSDSPTEDEGPWTESDTVSCAFVFTVTPVTDFPMIQMAYQATNDAPTYVDLVINTTKPADYKDTPAIETIEVGAPGAATLTAVTDSNLNDSSNGGSTWDGSKITLVSSVIGSQLGVTAITKVVKVTLTYNDKAGVSQKATYTAKVNVLAAPAAPQQQNPQNP